MSKKRRVQRLEVIILLMVLPSSGKITPAELMMIMLGSNCVIDSDRRKRVDVKEGMWSLKLLDKLLSG